LVNAPNAPIDFNTSSAVVYNTFITSLEADLIANDIKNRMKRLPTTLNQFPIDKSVRIPSPPLYRTVFVSFDQ